MSIKKLSTLLVLFVFSFLFMGALNVSALDLASTPQVTCDYTYSGGTVQIHFATGLHNIENDIVAYADVAYMNVDADIIKVDGDIAIINNECPNVYLQRTAKQWSVSTTKDDLATESYQVDASTAKLTKDTNNKDADSTTQCTSEQKSAIKREVYDSEVYNSLNAEYGARLSTIKAIDYDSVYKEYIKNGKTAAQAITLMNDYYNSIINKGFSSEADYEEYLSSIPAGNNSKNCVFDVTEEWYTSLLSRAKEYRGYLNTLASDLQIANINNSSILTKEQKKTALGIVDKSTNTNTDTIDLAKTKLITEVYKLVGNIDFGKNVDVDCSILTQDSIDFLNEILGYIKIIAPILVIILGSLDFGQAILSSDKDFLAKATSKFIKRCLAAVGLFFLPIILSYLLNLIPSVNNPLCGVSNIIMQLIKF